MADAHLTDVSFTNLHLPESLARGIADAGFERCTPIQAQTLPRALAGFDVAGQAQTGTGKTAAFLVALYSRLLRAEVPPTRKVNAPLAIIIAPTRELAVQIHNDEKGVQVGALELLGTAAVHPPQHLAQDVESMRRLVQQFGVFRRGRPRRAEHQAVLQRVLLRVAEVLAAQRPQVLPWIVEVLPGIQMLCKLLEAPSHHLGQQMVAARVVLVRCLVRHAQAARHVAQAQPLDAVPGNGLACCGDAGIAQFRRGR